MRQRQSSSIAGGDKNSQMVIMKKFSGVKSVKRSVHLVLRQWHVPHSSTILTEVLTETVTNRHGASKMPREITY
jgi:hypothetical protein